MNGFTLATFSSCTSIPTTARPSSRYFLSNSTYHGISTLQPPHVVAQKSNRTTFPLYCQSVILWPCTSVTVKSGAKILDPTGINSDTTLRAVTGFVQPACVMLARTTVQVRQ